MIKVSPCWGPFKNFITPSQSWHWIPVGNRNDQRQQCQKDILRAKKCCLLAMVLPLDNIWAILHVDNIWVATKWTFKLIAVHFQSSALSNFSFHPPSRHFIKLCPGSKKRNSLPSDKIHCVCPDGHNYLDMEYKEYKEDGEVSEILANLFCLPVSWQLYLLTLSCLFIPLLRKDKSL